MVVIVVVVIAIEIVYHYHLYPTLDCNPKLLAMSSMDEEVLTHEDSALVVSEGTEIYHYNYWLAAPGKTGEEAQVVVDLGCEKMINGVYLRNTHNGDRNDRGTERFSLFGSLSADGPMFDLGRGVLEDSRSQVAEKTEFFPFILPTKARFLMFQVDSFYGEGGGLHFLAENERDKIGQSYTGR